MTGYCLRGYWFNDGLLAALGLGWQSEYCNNRNAGSQPVQQCRRVGIIL